MTAPAGSGLSITAPNPSRALTANPAAVNDLIERRFLGCMVILRASLELRAAKKVG
jgi:hypothetical protein